MAPARAAWLELAVEADPEAVEAVSEILGRVASGGTSVEPAFELLEEGLSARLDPRQPAIVRGYVPARDAAAASAATAIVDEALGHLRAFDLRPIGALRTRLVDEADWAEAWKAHFPVLRIGRRIVIKPTWRRHRSAVGEIILALDPGMAFGTGLHPTTRLCLVALESLADRGRVAGARAVDVGSGSGILSIAAARLGARDVLALDVDPIAVEATIANVRRNRLAGVVTARLGSVAAIGGPSERLGAPSDLVIANLIASLLVTLAPDLAASVRPGGTWLASGIFRDRETDVRGAFDAVGLVTEDRWAEEDWVALSGRRVSTEPTIDG